MNYLEKIEKATPAEIQNEILIVDEKIMKLDEKKAGLIEKRKILRQAAHSPERKIREPYFPADGFAPPEKYNWSGF